MEAEPAAYLLDLDGTLLDSEPFHKEAEILAFRKMGLEIVAADILSCTGATLEAMLDFVHGRFSFRTTVEEFLSVQRPLFTEIIERDVDMFPDAIRFLNRKSRVRKAIVTSSMPWYLEIVRKKHPILIDAFDLMVCAADVMNGKPHPEPFQLAASRLGVSVSDCVAVEDSVNGTNSAKAAGCFVVGMDREGHGRLVNADQVAASFDELG